jgi:hypothetical protein
VYRHSKAQRHRSRELAATRARAQLPPWSLAIEREKIKSAPHQRDVRESGLVASSESAANLKCQKTSVRGIVV